VEQGAVADRIWRLHEGDTAIANRLVEVLYGPETAIGEPFVDEHPKMLGRLARVLRSTSTGPAMGVS
jgi:hypothetical protein